MAEYGSYGSWQPHPPQQQPQPTVGGYNAPNPNGCPGCSSPINEATVKKNGENFGRRFRACSLKKGDQRKTDACIFEWLSAAPPQRRDASPPRQQAPPISQSFVPPALHSDIGQIKSMLGHIIKQQDALKEQLTVLQAVTTGTLPGPAAFSSYATQQ